MDLTADRAAIAAELTAGGVRAFEYVDTVVEPPCAVVVPGQPFLDVPGPSRTDVGFGCMLETIDVLVLAQRDVNRESAQQMDDLIVDALTALTDRDVVRVSRPDVVTLNGVKYLGSVLTIEEIRRAP